MIVFSIFIILINLSFFCSIILLSYWNILLFSPSRRVLADHAVKVQSSIVIGLSIFLLILTALLLYSTIMIQLYYCVYINMLLHSIIFI